MVTTEERLSTLEKDRDSIIDVLKANTQAIVTMESRMGRLEGRMERLERDVTAIRQDVGSLKQDMGAIKRHFNID